MTSINIKPIETVYNGYRFRSRLEARWAVFFDAAGIRYVYEPEGFQVDLGDRVIRYLPDFYLPDFGIYVEVKGSDEQLRADAEKIGWCIDFQSTPVSKGLLILGPVPYKEGMLPVFDFLYWHKGVEAVKSLFAIEEGKAVFLYDTLRPSSVAAGPADMAWEVVEDSLAPFYNGSHNAFCDCDIPEGVSVDAQYFDPLCMCADYDRPVYWINQCYIKARQARFEHGEAPK